MISATAANSAAKTASAAGPRFQPRATSAPTTGSSPSASTIATKIESRTSSAMIASATNTPKIASLTSVRAGMYSSTGRRGSTRRDSTRRPGWSGPARHSRASTA